MAQTIELEKRLSSASPNSTYPAEGYDYLWKPPAWVIQDPQERIVEGYASLPNLDDQGDVIPLDVIDAALPAFMDPWANLREMHQQSAVGKVLAAKVDEKGLYIVAKIEDPTAWAKVKSGVYQGFSVGGSIPEDAVEQRSDGARIIKEVQLSEISLVDRPANPKARIGVVKLNKHFTGKAHNHKCEKHQKEGCEECGCDRLVGHPDGTGHSSGMADNPGATETEKASATSSFAYTDSSGKGHLPIGDAGHVRNALARFNQTHFESQAKADAAWGKIKAAAKRFGIDSEAEKPKAKTGRKPSSGYKKGIEIMDLQKVKQTLVDPDEIEALEKAEQILAKAGGNEWHTQRDVGNPKAEADEGADLMDNDGDEETTDEFLKSKQDGGPSQDPTDEEGAGQSAGKKEDEAPAQIASKADGGFAHHYGKCHKAMMKCHKALEDGHPAKPHAEEALGHLSNLKKCFGKAAETTSLSKALGSDHNFVTRAEFDEVTEAVQYVINVSKALTDRINGLPRSRPLPPDQTVERDDESRAARLALHRN